MAAPTTQIASPSTTTSALPTCTTAAPGEYGQVPVTACNSSYNAIPAFVPAMAVSVLFGILTSVHMIEACIFKKGYTWVLIMAAAWETTAFVLHALGAHDQQNEVFATVWQILFLLSPLWVNAFVYMTFARMVHFFLLPDRRVAFVKASHVSKLFVWADVLSFIVQAAGGIMVTPGVSPSTQELGMHIYEGGIGLQEAFILCFLALMIAFHVRIRKQGRVRMQTVSREEVTLNANGAEYRQDTEEPKGALWLLYALYAVLAFITMRIIFRLVEFTGGRDPLANPVPYHEYYFYALDAFPMMAALLILAVVHPGRFIRGPNSSLRDAKREGKKVKKALKKALKEQKRADKEAAYGQV
ncbi:RTA1 like domain-containing protein [Trichoderma novae-zelandiae]